MIGPAAVDAPITAPQTPMAALSFAAGKVLRSRASAVGCSIAPKTPCSTRKAMTRPRCSWPCRRTGRWPPRTSAKPTMPVRNTFLCPNRSPNLPIVISVTASASR